LHTAIIEGMRPWHSLDAAAPICPNFGDWLDKAGLNDGEDDSDDDDYEDDNTSDDED